MTKGFPIDRVRQTIKAADEALSKLRRLLLMMLCFGMPAFAQISTANVGGIVQDQSGASIQGASVKLINVQTGTENDSKTSREGVFLLPGVIPGLYTLQIDQEGFATTQLNGISLNVGDTKNLLIRLKIGPVTESVNVDASGLTLNTSSASVSTVVDRRFVGNIPLNGRSFQDLISMTPGIVTQSPQAAGEGMGSQGDFGVNGQKPGANQFFVDGVSANINLGVTDGQPPLTDTGSAAGLTALGTTQTLVSIDALQEFRVLSSTYSAEYGRTPGGQFSFLTRSGTNKMHGSLYDYFRTNLLDANDWFGEQVSPYFDPEAPFRQNDFGGTFGGPLILPKIYDGHDKTFFFLSYEGLQLAQQTPQTFQYTPAMGVIDGAPSALTPIWAAFPSASEPEIKDASGAGTGLAPIYFQSYSLPSHLNSTSVRLDHAVSPKLALFVRFGDIPSTSQSRQLWSFSTNQNHVEAFTVGATSQLAKTSSNDLRFGYIQSKSILDTRTEGYPFESDTGANLYTGLGIPPSASADVYVHIAGVGDTESRTDHLASTFAQWNLRDTFDIGVGSHHVKLGIDQRHIDATFVPPPLSVEAEFFDRDAMVTNRVSNLVITRNNPASPVINQFSAFAEDEWHISKSLTLVPGLRWELAPPPVGEHGVDAFTAVGDLDSPATLRLAPRGTPLWHTSWYNFAPRFGAAWLIHNKPNQELVLRAGGGAFFDTGNQSALKAFRGVGFTAATQSSGSPLPVAPSQLDFAATPVAPYTNTTAFLFPPHLQLPYSLQWNIAIEKALGKNQSATFSYVGAGGRRLLQEQRTHVGSSNPTFGDISYLPHGLTSNYQSLQMKFQRSVTRGVEALASYTWAHSLDYGSTSPLYPLIYGNSDLDIRHNFEAALSWDLPKPTRNVAAKTICGGWTVDGRLLARTGFPITLFGNLFSDPVTGERSYNGVDLIPNRPLYLYGSEYPGGRMLNGGPSASNPAFSIPSGTTQGNAPRNLVRGFGAIQANIAVQREFPIHDHLNLQFRAETFNIVNHPNFGYVDPFITDALFGRSIEMLNQSFGSTGALYQQGGPRSVQFALKLTF